MLTTAYTKNSHLFPLLHNNAMLATDVSVTLVGATLVLHATPGWWGLATF